MGVRTISDFYTESAALVQLFNAFAHKHALIGRTLPDHICYKCGSIETFERMREMLEGESAYIYQSVISNRRIAYVKLKRPFETALGSIYFLELSDQKPDGSQHDGFDHIEVYATAMSYNEMVTELEKTEIVEKVERPHHTTHDIDMGNGLLFRCTQGPLLEKIKASEML